MSERFEISVNKLHALTRQQICKKLDIREDYGGDFRTLAAHLDMSSDDLDLISQERNPTHKVLRWWGRNPENTVSKLREVLMEMGRLDCVKILDEIPETGMGFLMTAIEGRRKELIKNNCF